MRVTFQITKINPDRVQEIVSEDVESFRLEDSLIAIRYNKHGENADFVTLRDNDGEGKDDWTGLNISVTREGLKVNG